MHRARSYRAARKPSSVGRTRDDPELILANWKHAENRKISFLPAPQTSDVRHFVERERKRGAGNAKGRNFSAECADSPRVSRRRNARGNCYEPAASEWQPPRDETRMRKKPLLTTPRRDAPGFLSRRRVSGRRRREVLKWEKKTAITACERFGWRGRQQWRGINDLASETGGGI